MAEMIPDKKPVQDGVEDSKLDYYDIMVIGKTGMGKTTTVDKMLIANVKGLPSPENSTPQSSEGRRKYKHKGYTMWLVSDRPSRGEAHFLRVSNRLKKLVEYRSAVNPHEKVNQSHKAETFNNCGSTLECELLSNDVTKIRILDIPGFFGREACHDSEDRLASVKASALSTMRKVLRIRHVHNLNLRRIVYFLPVKGAPARTDQLLLTELEIMEKYFGRAIFDSMVVVATESLGAYKCARPGDTLFSDEEFRQTSFHLQEALQIVSKGGYKIPRLPIVFISLFDSCENIVDKIMGAKVLEDVCILAFKKSLCARCGLIIVKEGQNESNASYCISPESTNIPYGESKCHPAMIPKYSKLERIFGGILHLITFERFVGRWPNFETMDEVCVACNNPPEYTGCMVVGTEFRDGIIVCHSSSAIESNVEITVERTTEADSDAQLSINGGEQDPPNFDIKG